MYASRVPGTVQSMLHSFFHLMLLYKNFYYNSVLQMSELSLKDLSNLLKIIQLKPGYVKISLTSKTILLLTYFHSLSMNHLLTSTEFYHMYKKLNRMVFQILLNLCGVKGHLLRDKKVLLKHLTLPTSQKMQSSCRQGEMLFLLNNVGQVVPAGT